MHKFLKAQGLCVTLGSCQDGFKARQLLKDIFLVEMLYQWYVVILKRQCILFLISRVDNGPLM